MKKIITYISILMLGSIALPGQASNLDSMLMTGNRAYNQGLYDSALNVYGVVVGEGKESPELYYNMGNAYFKNNQLATAILYYEKAKKLSPNDEDIAYNLSIANSMIVDKIEKVPELFYKSWWNYFYNMFSADWWTILSIASWYVLVFFIGVFILSKTRRGRKMAFYFGFLFLFGTLVTFGLASQKYYFSKSQQEAIIFTPTITVKSSPTINSVDLFVIHEGTKIMVMDEVQDWVKIKIQDGSIGWLPKQSMKRI